MTSQRQEGYRKGRAAFRLLVTSALLLAGGMGLADTRFAARAATTERVVANRFTGLAIEGIDPVSYFTDARPIPGQADFEASLGGVVWRFSNPDNKAFFVARPDVYGPQ